MANKKNGHQVAEESKTFDYADENGNVIEESDTKQTNGHNAKGATHKECHCHDENDKNCGCDNECHCHKEHKGEQEKHHCCHDKGRCECENNGEVKEVNLDYLELAQRLKAEFDNYKRRNADVRAEAYSDGIMDVVKKLLPVLDGFHQATKNISDPSTLEGVELLRKQFVEALATFGVEKIDCVGKPFDPHSHNAVVAVEVEGVEPDMVVEEYQEGFKLKDKVIRHSVVRISK